MTDHAGTEGSPDHYLSDSEKIAAIAHIVAVHEREREDEEGDKYLSDPTYAMEAISAVLNGTEYGILGQFMEA